MTMRKHTELIQQYVEARVTLVDHIDLNLSNDRSKDAIFSFINPANTMSLAKKLKNMAMELSLETFGFDATAEGGDYWDDVVNRLRGIATNLERKVSGA